VSKDLKDIFERTWSEMKKNAKQKVKNSERRETTHKNLKIL